MRVAFPLLFRSYCSKPTLSPFKCQKPLQPTFFSTTHLQPRPPRRHIPSTTLLKPSCFSSTTKNWATFRDAFAKRTLTTGTATIDGQVVAHLAARPVPTTTTRPVVGYWLLGNAALVFGIVVLGGLTRLTESGLSIVEWKPVTGVLPPLTQKDWEEEFEKYKQFPEYKVLNKNMTLPEFKSIFYMEWGHRLWGRAIGLAFLLPAIYFVRKGYMTPGVTKTVCVIGALIGFQGALGWYMVKSGLDESLAFNNAVPRVSHYRLAAHLGTAFVLYSAMTITGLRVLRNAKPLSQSIRALAGNDRLGRYRSLAHLTAGLIFLTAISGAFVAGLDAGLLYNEFPLMGGRLVPQDIWSEDYATKKDGQVTGLWRNIFENPTTVQFNHRVLAVTTALTVLTLFAVSRRLPLSRRSRWATNLLAATAAGQVTLGICTLVYMVPIPLAAAHQAGSLTLLTAAMWLLHELKSVPK